MEIFKTMLFFSDFEQDVPQLCSTIWHEGAWRLVGTWLESPDAKDAIPEVLVRLPERGYQESNSLSHRFVLTNAIPKSVLRGDGHGGHGFEVTRYPTLAEIRPLGGIQ